MSFSDEERADLVRALANAVLVAEGMLEACRHLTKALEWQTPPSPEQIEAARQNLDRWRAELDIWAVESTWCAARCAQIMRENEGISEDDALARVWGEQAHLFSALVHGRSTSLRHWSSLRAFDGILPLEPWKPDGRQIAMEGCTSCAVTSARFKLARFETRRRESRCVRSQVY
jgi:hypothetical protein